MQIYPEKLAQTLSQSLKPLYLVSGDELLIVQEACDQILKCAKDQGFQERKIFEPGTDGNWDSLREEGASLSLFASKRIIDVRLSANKLDKDASVFLREWCDSPPEDVLLLIRTERLLPRQRKSAWFKSLDSIGGIILVWPIGQRDLPRWLNARLRSNDLQIGKEGLSYLAERVEGNLLSAAQLIEKMVLSKMQGDISLDQLYEVIEDSSRFGAFDLINATMAGESERLCHILSVLKEEGVSFFAILGALASQIRRVGGNLQGLPEAQKKVIGQFANRVGNLDFVLSEIALLDLQAKGGVRGGSEWIGLERLLLRLSGLSQINLMSEDRREFLL